MRVAASGAAAQAADATVNQITPMQKNRLLPVAIPKGPSSEEQGGEGQRVPGDHPLQRPEGGVELASYRRERYPDNRGVDCGHRRTEHRRRKDPAPGRRAVADCGHGRLRSGFGSYRQPLGRAA